MRSFIWVWGALSGAAVAGCSLVVDTDTAALGDGREPAPEPGGSNGGSDAGSCPSESCSDGFSPSNVGADFWDEDAPDVTLDSGATIVVNTTACNPNSVAGITVQLQDGLDACVVQIGNLTVGPNTTLRGEGSRPLILMVTGRADIVGAIDVSAVDAIPGPGGFRGGNRSGPAGSGPGFGGAGFRSTNRRGGGGGGGHCGDGGGSAEGDSSDNTGRGGRSVPEGFELIPLLGGSGGGQGARSSARGESSLGGGGGGALQISAQQEIVLRGRILAGGGGGQGGATVSLGTGGGGGGSGGSVLLEAPEVRIVAEATINAAGGGGGSGAASFVPGLAGQNGFEATERAVGGESSGFGSAPGGFGGGGESLAGESTGRQGEGDAAVNGGGGGGGAGCVLVRTEAGQLAGNGRFSPSVAPGLRALTLRSE